MWLVNKRRKLELLAASLVAAAVAGGGVAIAATKAWSPRQERQAVIDDAAKQLGVTPSALSDALKKALENRVDAAVADGRLTKAQGDELKKRIESSDTALPFGSFGLGLGLGLGLGPGPRAFDFKFGFAAPFAKFEAAASYLGLSESELQSRLVRGKTLAQIAKDRGKSVEGLVDALVKDAEKRIDAAVDSGKLTKSQGDDLKSGLRDRMTHLVNGNLQFRHGHGLFAPGFGFEFRRPGFFPGQRPFGRDFWPRRGHSA